MPPPVPSTTGSSNDYDYSEAGIGVFYIGIVDDRNGKPEELKQNIEKVVRELQAHL